MVGEPEIQHHGTMSSTDLMLQKVHLLIYRPRYEFPLHKATQVFHVLGSTAICWLCFSYRTHFSEKQKALFSSIFLVSGFLLHLDFSAVPAPPPSKKTLRSPSLPLFSSSLPALSQFSHQRRHPVRHREWMENMTGSFSPWLQIMC